MLAIYRSFSKNPDEIMAMYEMNTSTDLPEFQEQQFSLLIAGLRGILSEDKQNWSKKEMLHLFHVHIYLAPVICLRWCCFPSVFNSVSTRLV